MKSRKKHFKHKKIRNEQRKKRSKNICIKKGRNAK